MTDVLLFDTETEGAGHHAEYVAWLAEGWLARPGAGRLVIATPPATAEAPAVARAVLASEGRVVAAPFRPGRIPSHETAKVRLVQRAEREAFVEALEAHRPRHAIAMYFDLIQPLLARRVRLPAGVRTSGILFRAVSHYARIGSPATSVREGVYRLAKAALFATAGQHPSLEAVFSLDSEAAPLLRRLTRARIVPLADPLADLSVPTGDPRQSLRARYGIDAHRRVASLFGSLEPRKGIFVLLEALLQLPPSAASGLALVLAGRPTIDVAESLREAVDRIRAETSVQVVFQDGFIPAEEADHVVRGADLALLPYQRHVGSSGVLVRAAAAGVPVLAQAWGLLGHQVRTFGLGATVDAGSPAALAAALAGPWPGPPDPVGRAAFLAGRTPEQFAATVFDTLLGPAG